MAVGGAGTSRRKGGAPRGRIRRPDGMTGDETRLAGMLKALGNPVRFQIIKTLAERRTCITQEIVDTQPLAQSTISQHLKVLREAGLIRGEIEGPATCYCLDPQGVLWLRNRIGNWLSGCCCVLDPDEPEGES
jgi:ArsR family transcriptional regulator